MTLKEIIYDIREKLKLNTDDIDISNEYLAHLIKVKRAFFIKQRFSKFTRNIPEEVKQIICIDLEPVDSINGAPCFGKVLSSLQQIPGMIEIGGRSSLVGIRAHDILYPNFNIIPVERLPYVGYNKWLKNQIYVALDADNKLYFNSANPQHIELNKIKVVGVFSNPEEADNLSCTDSGNEECDFMDKEYPIEGYVVSDVVNMIMKELAPSLELPNDNLNNSDESNRN